ncbi:MAG: MCE family protein [Abditibacteriota bacterium]|nr:MCE family protein [Abditibacteriota bacterium]
MSKEFKVGFVVLIGIIALFCAYVFFHVVSFKSSTYEIKSTFKDLEKLDTGAVVRLSGFKIGNVTEIKLTEDSYVLVRMRIDKNIKIPKDSICMATTGAVIGEMFIKITPGDSKEYLEDGDTIKAISKASFDDLTKQLQTLLSLTNSSMEKVNDILGHKGYLISAMKNVEDITKEVKTITKDMGVVMNNVNKVSSDIVYISGHSREDLITAVGNIKLMTDNALKISNDLDAFVAKDALPQVKVLLGQSEVIMTNLNDSILVAKGILEHTDSKIDYVDDLISDADTILVKTQKTIDNVDVLLNSLNEVALTTQSAMGKIDNILGDKETLDEIHETITNIRDTSKEAKELMESLNKRFGLKDKDGNVSSFKASASSENMYIDKDRKFRSDLYADLFLGQNGVRIGVNDLGEDNNAIIQYQRKFNNNNIGKIGLFNSKLGLGYEYINNNFSSQLEWYNPNRSELYFKSKYKFSPNMGLFMGVDDIIHKDNRNFFVGLSFEK